MLLEGGERGGGVSGVRESPGLCWAQHGTAWHCDFLVGVAGKSRPSAGVIVLVVCTAELLVEVLGSVSHGTAQAVPLLVPLQAVFASWGAPALPWLRPKSLRNPKEAYRAKLPGLGTEKANISGLRGAPGSVVH